MKLFRTVAAVMLIGALTGCNAVGPKTINHARRSYNEAIAQSADEQLLLNLVRLKYRDTPLFLEVTSVSAQYNVNYSLAGKANFITSTNREASAGAGFSEKPTIQYTPLQGNKFVTQILTPLRLETLVLLARSGWSIERILRLCVQELGPLKNAPTASGPTPEKAPEYREFVDAVRAMRRLQGAIDIGIAAEEKTAKLVVRLPRASTDSATDLRRLLGVSPQRQDLLFNQRFGTPPEGELSIETRSIMGVLYYLSQNVQVPERHLHGGRVTLTTASDGAEFDWGNVLGDLFTVRSRLLEPQSAAVKVYYRGTWFYIDDRDLQSKTTFGLLSQLFALQAGEVQSMAPALTLSLGN